MGTRPVPIQTPVDNGDLFASSIESIEKSVYALRSEIETLTMIKNMSLIHYEQYRNDYEQLRELKAQLSRALSMSVQNGGQISQSVPKEVPIQVKTEEVPKSEALYHKELAYMCDSNYGDAYRNAFKLKYTLCADSLICAIAFNADGSLFTFSDSKRLFLIVSSDGSLLRAAEIPEKYRISDSLDNNFPRAIGFSYNSSIIAVAINSNILLYNTQNLQFVGCLEGHTKDVSSLAFNKNSNGLISGGFDGTICIWDLDKKALVNKKSFPKLEQQNSQQDGIICSVAISHEESYVAIGFMGGVFAISDMELSSPPGQIKAHDEILQSISISHQDTMLATVSRDKTIKLWSLKGITSCSKTLKGHTDFVLSASFSPNDALLATSSKDETIKIWDLKKGDNIATLTSHKNTIFQVLHHPTDNALISCSGDGLVCYWEYKLPN